YQAVSSYLRHYDASLITDQYTVLTRLIDDYQHRTEQCYHEQGRKMSQQEEEIAHRYRSQRQAIEKDITALRRQWREG
ncbi:hypothetical protein QLT03_09700, partial [Streptococcus equi subsp. zooepidemicus]|nr:hypothetical protein [Streptococcus equi subsp. zooepidemicus]